MYFLTNDQDSTVMRCERHYDDTLALQWAMRELKGMKDNGIAPSHATLWQRPNFKTTKKVQGFYRKDN